MGCVVLLLLVIGVIGVIVFVAAWNANERRKAHEAYQDALASLKRDPANPDVRETALARGRAYSNATRNWRGVMLFDEVALMNDINAASAAAARQPALPAPAPHTTVEERLTRLSDLRARGLVGEDEYAEQRRRILSDV